MPIFYGVVVDKELLELDTLETLEDVHEEHWFEVAQGMAVFGIEIGNPGVISLVDLVEELDEGGDELDSKMKELDEVYAKAPYELHECQVDKKPEFLVVELNNE